MPQPSVLHQRFSVLCRRDADVFFEYFDEIVAVVVADLLGGLIDGCPLHEQLFRRLQPHARKIIAERCTHFVAER